jgi:hypothetical protein
MSLFEWVESLAYLCEATMYSSEAGLDEAIESRPLSTVAEGHQVFFAHDELLLQLIA